MRMLYEGRARKHDAAVLATFATIIERSVYKASAESARRVPPAAGTAP
jgi:hypothetical protein